MKNSILTLFVLLFALGACKKEETSTPEKQLYKNKVFAATSKTTVVYNTNANLEMDIYQPVGDNSAARPVVILAHGGGFFVGSKENPAMVRLAKNFAKRGYVAASINYHLAPDVNAVLDSVNAADLVVKAIGDAKSAVRYLRKSHAEGNPYGIDTSALFFGGNSAGAILAVHMGLFDQNDPKSPHLSTAIANNGGFEGNGGNNGFSSYVHAVFNLAGAIKNTNMIDAQDVPIISFHGVDDDVVPYNCGDVYSSFGLDVINVCGSNSMHAASVQVGHSHTLHSYLGQHVPWMNATTGEPYPLFDEVENKIVEFLYQQL